MSATRPSSGQMFESQLSESKYRNPKRFHENNRKPEGGDEDRKRKETRGGRKGDRQKKSFIHLTTFRRSSVMRNKEGREEAKESRKGMKGREEEEEEE